MLCWAAKSRRKAQNDGDGDKMLDTHIRRVAAHALLLRSCVASRLEFGLDCGPGPDRQRVALAAGHEVAREAPALAVLATRHVRHKMISAGAGNSSTRTGWTVFWVNRGVVVLQAAHVRSVC